MFEYLFTKQAYNDTEFDFTPTRASIEDAGYDLRACLPTKQLLIYPKETVLVGSGVCIHIGHAGYVGLLIPRSSTGKRGIMLKNTVGVIDSGYTNEIGMLLTNTNEEDILTISHGDRIAQLVLLPIVTPTLTRVENFTCFSMRGTNGFGSTGVN